MIITSGNISKNKNWDPQKVRGAKEALTNRLGNKN